MVTQHLFVVDSIKWVHLFQSLDVAVFVPMKATWKVELENWPKESRTKNLLKEHFLLPMRKLINACRPTSATNLEVGFRTCGLYLLSHKEILRKILRTISQESADVSMNEILINLLKQNRAKKVGRKEEEERRYH